MTSKDVSRPAAVVSAGEKEKNEMTRKVKELRELKRMRDELNAEIEALTDELKGIMVATGKDEIIGDDYKITYKEVTTTRLDTAKLKAELPKVAEMYTKETTARRFNLY